MLRFLSTALALSVGVLGLNWNARCQTNPSQQDLTFEVASVRPATRPYTTMEGDPGRIRYTAINLKNLVVSAYNVRYDSVVGPAWLEDVRVDIAATFPPETSREQFRLMLLHLLEERFGLVAHLESKQMDGYALVVADTGPRLKPTTADGQSADQSPLPEVSPSASTTHDEDGFPMAPAGPGVRQTCRWTRSGSACRFRADSASMKELAEKLPSPLSIVDETHLPGKYEFVLTADVRKIATPRRPEPPSDPNAEAIQAQAMAASGVQDKSFPDIFQALEKQLGLRLVRKKAPTPVVYVDHIEKTATEN
jgi:uncharacterized protein (TIGR03435 family)